MEGKRRNSALNSCELEICLRSSLKDKCKIKHAERWTYGKTCWRAKTWQNILVDEEMMEHAGIRKYGGKYLKTKEW